MENEIVVEKTFTKIIPLPVKILAIINFFIAILTWVSGVWAIVAGSTLSNIIGKLFGSYPNALPTIGTLGSVVFGIVGFIVILMGFISFFVGKGLWSGKNWARIFVIVISILGTIGSLGSVISGNFYKFIPLIIYAGIGIYFLFNKSVKESFIKVSS